MKFLVMSEREIQKYNVKDNHIIISVRSPKYNKAVISDRPNCLDILYLEFHDLDGVNLPSSADYKLFTKQDAKTILNFVTRYILNIELIICQCEAGISRSAGIAGALGKILNGDDTEFFKKYIPNMLVYKTILNEAK